MAKLLIVDDHEVVRSGLRRMLEGNDAISDISDCASGEEAYAFLFKNSIDIIIMDISMPGKGGLEATAQIKKRYPAIKIIILSMHDNSMIINKAIDGGADAYILKNELSDNLIDTINKVLSGSQTIMPSVNLKENDQKLEQLNNKEFEIFISIANGEDLKDIATKLNISYKTAANYQTSIKQKLDIKNTLDFYNIAKTNDLLPK